MVEEWKIQQVDSSMERHVEYCLDIRDVPNPEHVQVRAEGGIVQLQGWIESERSKDLLVRCCRRVPGVVRLVDDLVVKSRPAVESEGSIGKAGDDDEFPLR
jgi:osmotically-inducible protein OsmY